MAPNPSHRLLLPSIIVVAIAIFLNRNSLQGEFVFDDHEAIESNLDVRTDTPLSSVFLNDFWGNPLSDPESHKSYRPLTIISFRLNRIFNDLTPWGYHAVNVATHIAVSLLFLWFCAILGLTTDTSLYAALLFTSHPIHTEAVANVVGRTELLSAAFFLLSLLAYHRSLHRDGTQRPEGFSLLFLLLSVAFSVISLLCKEQGVTAMAVCVTYDVIVVCGFDWQWISEALKYVCRRDFKETKIPRWLSSLLNRLLIMTCAAVSVLLLRLIIMRGGSPHFVESDNPASFSPHRLTRLLTYSYLCAVDFWLLLCPSRLCFDWSMGSIPLVESVQDWRNAATCGLVALLSLLTIYGVWSPLETHSNREQKQLNSTLNHLHTNGTIVSQRHPSVQPKIKPSSRVPNLGASSRSQSKGTRRKLHGGRRRQTLFALSLVILPFLPASNLFFAVGFVVAERVLYLPSMGMCLLVAIGYSYLSGETTVALQPHQQQRKEGGSLVSAMSTVALLFILLAFSVKTVYRNGEWANTQALAKSALKVNPGNAKVYMTMGNVLAQQGNRTCEPFYREAIRLRPHYAAAWTNLGLVLLNTDRPLEAEECYRKALSIKSDHINANANMGHLCRLQERWAEAREYYTTAVRRRPRNSLLHYNIGFVSEKIGTSLDMQTAEEEYEEAIRLHPGYPEAHLDLARLLASTSHGQKLTYGYTKGKRSEKAVQHYQKAIQLKPDDTDARYELGKLLLTKGKAKEAEEQLHMAVRLSPSHASAHMELGLAHEQLGWRQRALRHLEKAIELDSTLTIAREKLRNLKV